MKRSIFVKIFAGYFIIICLFSVCIFFFSFRIIKHYHIKTLTNDLQKLGQILISNLGPLLQNDRIEELDASVKSVGKHIETRITVIDTKGVVLADSEKDPQTMENHKTRPEIIQAIYGNVGSSLRYSTTVKESMLYVAVPIRQGETVNGVLRVSLFLSNINRILNDIRISILYIACSIMLIVMIGSFIVSRRLTNPIRKLNDASRKVASGDLDVRVFLKSNDELHEFADSFNYMTEKIRSLFEEVSLQKEELKNIISSMQEGLLVIDYEGKIIMANDSFQKIVQTENIQSRYYWEVIRQPQFGEIIQKVKIEHKSCVEEMSCNERTFLCSASYIAPKEEVVITLLDISEIKNVERMKKDFIINVSHELRTPLTAIKGFVETIEEEADDTNHSYYLEIIKRNTDRLINIVKDLLFLSRLEKEHKLELEKVKLNSLVEQVIKIYEQKLKEKNLSLKIEMPDEPLWVQADHFELEQVFVNLIDNAIQYTETGVIRISLQENTSQIIISIEDTGIGMSQDHLPKIFERFYVVDKSRSRSLGGTGLGLSIVKHIVRLHHGTIDVQSTLGVGTKFTITLPLNHS